MFLQNMKVCAQHSHSGVGTEPWCFRLCVLALNMLTHERQSVHVYAVPSHGEDTHTKASAVENSLDSLHI